MRAHILYDKIREAMHARGYGGKEVVAVTPHGSYIFDITGIEYDDATSRFVLRLVEQDSLAPLPTDHVVTITPPDQTGQPSIFVQHSLACRDALSSTGCRIRVLARMAFDGGHVSEGTYDMRLDETGVLLWDAR